MSLLHKYFIWRDRKKNRRRGYRLSVYPRPRLFAAGFNANPNSTHLWQGSNKRYFTPKRGFPIHKFLLWVFALAGFVWMVIESVKAINLFLD